MSLYAGTVICHYKCKHHGFHDTGFKQTEHIIFCMLSQWDEKKGTAFKCIVKETVPKWQYIFESVTYKTLTRTNMGRSVLNFGFTEPQKSNKCWSNLLRKCHIFTIGKIHAEDQHNHRIHALVGLFWTINPLRRYHYIVKWCHHCTSIWIE